ncbi:MAG: gamma-glutamylcyclotransferase [Desulfobacterales bacterium]|nr:MAG: gamma-glutamylcyclotransferase [Desulfobacterales bacterium]
MTDRLFCYGTLQVPEVIHTVTGRTYDGLAAQLPGFAIKKLRDAQYPAVIDSPDDETAGILYTGLSEEDLALLDLFEGELYQRKLLKVSTPDGQTCKAWVYVIKDQYRHKLTQDRWYLQEFLDKGFQSFMQNYVEGRRQIYARRKNV